MVIVVIGRHAHCHSFNAMFEESLYRERRQEKHSSGSQVLEMLSCAACVVCVALVASSITAFRASIIMPICQVAPSVLTT